MKKRVVFLLLAFSLSSISATSEPNGAYFTAPVCKSYNYLFPLKSNAGETIAGKPKNAYCSDYEIATNLEQNHRTHITRLFNREDIASIKIIAFTFNDVSFAEKICDIVSEQNVNVDLVLSSVVSNGKVGGRKNDAIEVLEACNESGRIRIDYAGHYGGIVSFHPKLYIITYRNNEYSAFFGSGHFKKGLTIHFDHWFFYSGMLGDDFWNEHQCFFDAVNVLAKEKQGLVVAYPHFEECIRGLEKNHTIKSYFLPFQRAGLLAEIDVIISESRNLDIAVFSFNSERLLLKLLKALKNGAEVRILMDDDVYWASQYECTKCMSEANTHNGFLKVLEEWGAKVRYLQTNHHTSGNIMHHKMLITKNQQAEGAVLFGSANFTEAAFGEHMSGLVGNIENSYITRSPETVKRFDSEFQRLWDLATSEKNMPKTIDPYFFK